LESHDKTLSKVLHTLANYHVKINFDKSNFRLEEIEVLGCIINCNGIKTCLKNLNFEKFSTTR